MTETLLKTKYTEVVKESNGYEMIKRPVAVAILAVKENGDTIMVKQERGSFGTILEVPAGKVDKDELPIDAVRRELREETGYECGKITQLISYFPSVGYSTEEIQCFYTDELLEQHEQRLDDGERIELVYLSPEQIFNKIASGEIKDSKTLMCMFGTFVKGAM